MEKRKQYLTCDLIFACNFDHFGLFISYSVDTSYNMCLHLACKVYFSAFEVFVNNSIYSISAHK
jgi:hypothetical protein